MRFKGVTFMRGREVDIIYDNDTRTETPGRAGSPTPASIGKMSEAEVQEVIADGWTPVRQPHRVDATSSRRVIGIVESRETFKAVAPVRVGKTELIARAPAHSGRYVLWQEGSVHPVSTAPYDGSVDSDSVPTVSVQQLHTEFSRNQTRRGLSTEGSLHRVPRMNRDANQFVRARGGDPGYRVPKSEQGGFKFRGPKPEPQKPKAQIVSKDGIAW